MQRLFLSFCFFSTSLFAGCAVTDFVGAYFNTYYNAQKLFSEAEDETLNSASKVTGRAERAFLAPFEVPPQTRGKFTSVIEKCSKLLQYHPDSKLVDDALLMIGKSYYYQNEHQSAERKFKELIESYPESDLALEAGLLLANTYYRMSDKITSATNARQLIQHAQEQDEPEIVAKAALLLATIEVEAKDYEAAHEYYQQGAEAAQNAEERSTAYRKAAEMYELQLQYKNAADAFALSEAASSEYTAVYRGQIGRARMLSRLGLHDQSLAILEDLIKNTNYREFFGEIDLEIANVYRDQKDYPSAEAQYRYVDTAYARTEAAANSYYQLGLLYETKLLQYDSARVAYEKGKVEFPQAEITPMLLRKSSFFNKYFSCRTELAKYDSIRLFLLTPPDTTETALSIPDSTARDSLGNGLLVKADSLKPKAPVTPPPPMDTVLARLAFNKSELGGLFYTGLQVVDSAKYFYQRLLSDHPKSNQASRALYTLIQIYTADSSVSRSSIDSLHNEIITRFPNSEFADESRRLLELPPLVKEVHPAEALFHQSELMIKRGDFTSALSSLNAILEKDSTSSYAAKAQYTIGWLYENMKADMDSSIASYERLVRKFPNSEFASIVQPRLAEVAMERQRKLQGAVPDTTSGQQVDPGGDALKQRGVNPDVKYAPPQQTDSVRTDIRNKKDLPQKNDEEVPKP